MAQAPAVCYKSKHVYPSPFPAYGDLRNNLTGPCPYCRSEAYVVDGNYQVINNQLVGLIYNESDLGLLLAYQKILAESKSKSFRNKSLRTDLENLNPNWKNLWGALNCEEPSTALIAFNLVVTAVGICIHTYQNSVSSLPTVEVTVNHNYQQTENEFIESAYQQLYDEARREIVELRSSHEELLKKRRSTFQMRQSTKSVRQALFPQVPPAGFKKKD